MGVKVLTNLSKEESELHEKKFGHFNTLPSGVKESTQEKFMSTLKTWVLEKTEFRQPKEFGYANCQLFFFNNEDYFLIRFNNRTNTQTYFTFEESGACEHEYGPAVTKGRCYTESTCKKCGHVHAVDSSD